MAARKLKSYVHVHEVDGDGNHVRTEVFGPDDKLPAWAKKHLGDHVWDDGDVEDEDPLDLAVDMASGPEVAARAKAEAKDRAAAERAK